VVPDALHNGAALPRRAADPPVRSGPAIVAAVRAHFASDNYAPVLPEVMAAIAAANHGHDRAYGADAVTARLEERMREEFGPEASTFLALNGTGANVVALRAMLRPWQGVLCAGTAHLNVDEGGAPEAMAGIKLLSVPTPDGKLTPELVATRLVRFGDEHAVQPGVVSVTQTTELGTLYTPAELTALAEQAHEHGLLLHVDGARLPNAAAALGLSLRAITTDAGVDAVSFGGTKAGLMLGEAIVLLRPDLAPAVPYLRKQSMQLASKMRFIAAQFEALLADELWRRAAGHANAMAARLAERVRGIDGVVISQEVQANVVFANLPAGVAERLQEEWSFYTWDERTGEVRWMCAWDTTPEEVDAFAVAIAAAVG
jgi:threonine aldolase